MQRTGGRLSAVFRVGILLSLAFPKIQSLLTTSTRQSSTEGLTRLVGHPNGNRDSFNPERWCGGAPSELLPFASSRGAGALSVGAGYPASPASFAIARRPAASQTVGNRPLTANDSTPSATKRIGSRSREKRPRSKAPDAGATEALSSRGASMSRLLDGRGKRARVSRVRERSAAGTGHQPPPPPPQAAGDLGELTDDDEGLYPTDVADGFELDRFSPGADIPSSSGADGGGSTGGRDGLRRGLLRVTKGRFGCSMSKGMYTHENNGRGPVFKPLASSALSDGQKALQKCLQDAPSCGAAAAETALRLESVRLVHAGIGPQELQKRRWKTCALVGNGGGLSRVPHGTWIDRHDAVVRFNAMPVGGEYSKTTGNRTTVRVLNHSRSRHVCCQGQIPEGKRASRHPLMLLIWHPGGQAEMLEACKKRFPNATVLAVDPDTAKVEAEAMRSLRKDLQLLGMGPFGAWKQLTSGAHALFALLGACDSVSLYGFSTYDWPGSEGLPDQYGGRAQKSRSGLEFHDWNGERAAWRLLHAAGRVTICSV